MKLFEYFTLTFFDFKTHKFNTQTPYGDWQCMGDRIRYVINTGFLEFIEGQAYVRWSSDHERGDDIDPDEVLEEFDNQVEHYRKSQMGDGHILTLKEVKEAYRILRKDIPELKEKRENSSDWKKWGDCDDEIIQKKHEAARIISDYLDWMWI